MYADAGIFIGTSSGDEMEGRPEHEVWYESTGELTMGYAGGDAFGLGRYGRSSGRFSWLWMAFKVSVGCVGLDSFPRCEIHAYFRSP